MSTENTIVEVEDTDLDTFSADFFGQKEASPEPASSEEVETEDPTEDAPTNDDTHEQENGDDTPEDEIEEAEEAPKPKKNRFQERIDELTGKQREAERRATDLEQRLNDALAKINGTPEKAPVVANKDEPTPDDKHEDGTDKYPLGEYDPNYIKDLTKFAHAQERAEYKAREDQERQAQEDARAKSELTASWNEKLEPARERYPDFEEKGQELISSFSSLPEAYGEYLAATLMSMDYGPDVLYYLSNNPDEARKIVNSGANKATIALGRLEAKFAFAEEEKQKARPKVSKAPEPPLQVNKGAAAVKAEVDDDTDDLDAFEKKFFDKRRQ